MILMKTLAKGKLGQEMVPELGLAISRDPTIEFSSNLDGIYKKPQCGCAPKIDLFGWL